MSVLPKDYHEQGALISRGVFLRWTGLTRWDLARLVEAGEIRTWRPRGSRYQKYYKTEAARIAGWRID